MTPRLAGIRLYISILALWMVTIAVAYWLINISFWFRCTEISQNETTENISMTYDKEMTENVLMAYDKEMTETVSTVYYKMTAFDRMIQYILHPVTPCNKPELLGGKVYGHNVVDGDKLLCLDPGHGLLEGCLVYSFGVNNEWSFEEAIRDRHKCEVHAFDPSMFRRDHMHGKDIWFYNMGIGAVNEEVKYSEKTWSIRTFKTILEQRGHSNKTIDVLKMDIEGDEFGVLVNLLEDGLLKRVNHLCVEIHILSYPWWQQVLDLLKRIETESGLRHFSTRNNTSAEPRMVPGFERRKEQFFFELAWYRP